MTNILNYLFETRYWPQRWNCGQWTDALGWTHIISDTLIFLAYFAIPCILVYGYLKTKGFALQKVFILFALFILFCGTGHLVEAIIFYHPVYRFAGLMKASTAIVSWATVFALMPYVQKLMELPKLAVINQDLSEQLEIERKRLRLAYEGSAAGLWDFNLLSHERHFSRNFLNLIGYNEKEFSEQYGDFESILHPSDFEKYHNALSAHFQEGKQMKVEVRLLTKSSSYRWFVVHGKSQGNLFVGSISDIDEVVRSRLEKEKLCQVLKETNEELVKKKKILEDFTFQVAHDLKEPIRGMGSYALILMGDFDGIQNEQARIYIEKISTLSSKSLELIDKTLNIATISGDEKKLNQFSLEELVNDLVGEFDDPNKKMQISLINGNHIITGQKIALENILRNLIGNAVKYNPNEVKRVVIGCQENDMDYEISVKDNGRGIPENEIDKIFKMFYRVEEDTSDGGTGLGLMIVEKIVTKFGGKIRVESEVGRGSTFYINIPKEHAKDC